MILKPHVNFITAETEGWNVDAVCFSLSYRYNWNGNNF